MGEGNLLIVFTHPISLVLTLAAIGLGAGPGLVRVLRSRRARHAPAARETVDD